jgi:uncharacterized protein YodC (DUF2158 family)
MIPILKTGDVVLCNEHPHAMTVRTVTHESVTCDWFVEATPFQAVYPFDSIIRIPIASEPSLRE